MKQARAVLRPLSVRSPHRVVRRQPPHGPSVRAQKLRLAPRSYEGPWCAWEPHRHMHLQTSSTKIGWPSCRLMLSALWMSGCRGRQGLQPIDKTRATLFRVLHKVTMVPTCTSALTFSVTVRKMKAWRTVRPQRETVAEGGASTRVILTSFSRNLQTLGTRCDAEASSYRKTEAGSKSGTS